MKYQGNTKEIQMEYKGNTKEVPRGGERHRGGQLPTMTAVTVLSIVALHDTHTLYRCLELHAD